MGQNRPEGVASAGVAVDAFGAAVGRFVAARADSPEPLRAFVPLAEALWWATSADEAFETESSNWDYRSRRNSHPAGQVVRGVRYVRNRVGHQRALVIRPDYFRRYQQGAEGDWYRIYQFSDDGWHRSYEYDFYWRSLDDLPRPNPWHPDRAGAEAYRRTLEGKPAKTTLDQCQEWLSVALRHVAAP